MQAAMKMLHSFREFCMVMGGESSTAIKLLAL